LLAPQPQVAVVRQGGTSPEHLFPVVAIHTVSVIRTVSGEALAG